MSTATAGQLCRNSKCRRLAAPGRGRCEGCLASSRRSTQKRRDAAKAHGMCQSCHKVPPLRGKSRCRECVDRYYRAEPRERIVTNTAADRNREIRKHRRLNGLCMRCGLNPVKPGKSRCRDCLDDMAVNRKTAVPAEPKRIEVIDIRHVNHRAWYMSFRNNMPTMYEPEPTIEFLEWAPERVSFPATKSN